jgi:hypothetical protein
LDVTELVAARSNLTVQSSSIDTDFLAEWLSAERQRTKESALESSTMVQGRPRALETILLGGVAVAVLDATLAMVFWWLERGTEPHVI